MVSMSELTRLARQLNTELDELETATIARQQHTALLHQAREDMAVANRIRARMKERKDRTDHQQSSW